MRNVGKKHERTKATDIPKKVKEKVYERDEQKCVVCGVWCPPECACCHYIGRGRLGLGIEKNIITLCPRCHYSLDNGEVGREKIRKYLESKYPDWNEKDLIYSKWKWTDTL